MLFIHGTKDRTIPYNGGMIRSTARERLLSAPEHALFWARHNGCLDTFAKSELPDVQPADKTRIRVSTFQSCPTVAPIQLLTVEGGGHQSPIAEQNTGSKSGMGMLGNRSYDIDATETMWTFFNSVPPAVAGGVSEQK